jgi:hypothetical protein
LFIIFLSIFEIFLSTNITDYEENFDYCFHEDFNLFESVSSPQNLSILSPRSYKELCCNVPKAMCFSEVGSGFSHFDCCSYNQFSNLFFECPKQSKAYELTYEPFNLIGGADNYHEEFMCLIFSNSTVSKILNATPNNPFCTITCPLEAIGYLTSAYVHSSLNFKYVKLRRQIVSVVFELLSKIKFVNWRVFWQMFHLTPHLIVYLMIRDAEFSNPKIVESFIDPDFEKGGFLGASNTNWPKIPFHLYAGKQQLSFPFL